MFCSKLLNCSLIPQRYILVIMCCLSLVIATSMGGSIVIILYELTVTPKIVKVLGNACLRDDKIPQAHAVISELKTPRYEWSSSLQGYIQISFIWGQLLTNIPSGIIADKYGGKWVLGLGLLFAGIISMLTPISIIYYDAIGLIFARILLGCCNGCIIPAINSLLSRWVPFDERGRSGVIVYSGVQIGNQLGYVFPVIVLSHFETLLPVYYFWGLFAIFWFFIFVAFCYSDPMSHPFVTPSEVEYLYHELVDVSIQKNLKIPWNEILTSRPMIAYYVAVIGNSWGLGILLIIVPKYYINMLQFTQQETILRMTISNMFLMFTTIIPGFICDWMIGKQIMSVTFSRKCWTILACAGPGIFLLMASYADCKIRAANILFTICIALFGPWNTGLKLNALDLAPNYSGTIMGITNGIAAFIGFLLLPLSHIIVSTV